MTPTLKTAEAVPAGGELWRGIIKYSLPLVAANLLQSLYGLTDMFLAGRFIGDTGLSAINNGSLVMTLFTGIIVGLSNGGNVMTGQYTGAGEKEKRAACAGCFISLFVLIGLAGAALLYAFAPAMMRLMKAPALTEASRYIALCAPGALAIACYNAASAVFRGIGNSRYPLYFVSSSVIINVVLDILFLAVFKMGVAGTAIATTISQFVSCLLSLWFLLLRRSPALALRRADYRLRPEYMGKIIRIGFPCAVQMTVASISWLSVAYLLNGYGVYVSAANGASAKIKEAVQTVTAALSMAATSLIAQALGARDYVRAKAVMYRAMLLALGMSLALSVLAEIFAPALIGLFSDEPEVIRAGVMNLRIEIPAQLFYAVFLLYHSLMTAAGHTGLVLFSSFANCILVRSVLAVYLSSLLGAAGVYLACLIAPTVSIPIGMIYTRRGRWRRSLS